MQISLNARLVGLGILLVPLASASGDEVALAADFEHSQRESYAYTNHVSQVQSGTFGNQEVSLDYTLEFDLSVAQVSDLYIDLEMVFTRIVVDSTNHGEFDSDDPPEGEENNLVAKAMRPVIGATFDVRLDADRAILGITGPSDPNVPDQMYDLRSRMFSERWLTEGLQPIFRLKARPATAAHGDTWSLDLERKINVGRMRIAIERSLEGVDEQGRALVSIGGQFIIRDVNNTPVSQRITEQHVKGDALWSPDEARLERFDLEKQFTLTAGGDTFDLTVVVTEREQLDRAK